MLVSVHVFLEMLHYCVWLVALPLIGRAPAWDAKDEFRCSVIRAAFPG